MLFDNFPQVGIGAAAPIMPFFFSPAISSMPSTGEQVQKRFESPYTIWPGQLKLITSASFIVLTIINPRY